MSVFFLSMDSYLLRSKRAVPVRLKVQSSFEGVFVYASVCATLGLCESVLFKSHLNKGCVSESEGGVFSYPVNLPAELSHSQQHRLGRLHGS